MMSTALTRVEGFAQLNKLGWSMFYSLARISKMLAVEVKELEAFAANKQKSFLRKGRGGWGCDSQDIEKFTQHFGYLKSSRPAQVITCFVTKGGVLKTTLSLNLARLLAMHGIRTLVIGLDLQADVTSALGYDLADHNTELKDILRSIDSTRGLYDYAQGDVGLEDIIVKTDLPALDLIPETPELMSLEQQLISRARREFWLKEKVVEPLKQRYEVIILDCSPNWNQLITNALTATDLLISPIECKINNYRNLKMFIALMNQFKSDLELKFKHLYVPTRLSATRKLSKEIFSWYQENVPGCSPISVRESLDGEEATAMHLSIPEFAPDSLAAVEMRELVKHIWQLAHPSLKEKNKKSAREVAQAKEMVWPSA